MNIHIPLNKFPRGQKLIKKKRYADAITLFERGVNKNTNTDQAFSGLAVTYYSLKNYPKALEAVVNAVLLQPGDVNLKQLFLCILKASRLLSYEKVIADELYVCLQNPLLFDIAAPLASIQLKAKFEAQASLILPENTIDFSFQANRSILLDKMFLDLLYKTKNVDVNTEKLLTEVRKQILLDFSSFGTDSSGIKMFITTLAHACFNNSYVFFVGAEENTELEKLERNIVLEISQIRESSGDSVKPSASSKTAFINSDLELKILQYALYNNLSNLECAEHILAIKEQFWQPSFYLLLKRTLINKKTEDKIKSNLKQFGNISNEISKEVKTQYEEHPYPFWTYVKAQETYKHRLRTYNFTLPKYFNSKLEILIAGAGTGQHVISTSLAQTKDNITAVDLSSTSLAYGVRMAKENNINNVDFIQGDLLNIGQLNKKFHVIECAGVLHHMQDPMKGWQALVDVLHDGGMMYVGLYSEIARQHIVSARNKISELNLTGKNQDIRDFRKKVLDKEFPEFESIVNIDDFYSLPECRDLIFHVQEHRFTLPQIQENLDKLGLRFVGMINQNPIPDIIEYLGDKIPKSLKPSQLEYWEFVENQIPVTFSQMYQLWLVKT